MKTSKQASLSTDTRLSRSGIFNNSSLNTSSLPPQTKTVTSTQKNFYMSNNIHNCENREIEFLRVKNGQLEEKNRRLMEHVRQLESNKGEILNINGRYVDVVNRYYECRNRRSEKYKGMPMANFNINDIKNIFQMSPSEAHKVLDQLEKDYRNLVKHCLVMQQQIKNYQTQMQKFNEMKSQLKSVNHTTVKDLVQQLEDLTEQNKNLRKTFNQTSYELQKSKEECKRVKKIQAAREKEASDGAGEIAKLRSLVNTTQQESLDKANGYEARIYELELKVQRLQKQLRQHQQSLQKTQTHHKNLQIKQVQQVHDYQKLQKNLTDLLKNRQRANSQYARMRSNSANKSGLQISVGNALERHRNAVTISASGSFGYGRNRRGGDRGNIVL